MASSDPDPRLLLLMRHGKAESGSGTTDHERELADRGITQAHLVGEYLDAQGVQISRVLVSTATRTQQTWDAVRAKMPEFTGEVSYHEEIYGGGTDDLLDLLRAVDDEHQVLMVIGHEPVISTLSDQLADEDSDAGSAAQARIGMPTGGMAVLTGELPQWSQLGEETLTLHTIVRP